MLAHLKSGFALKSAFLSGFTLLRAFLSAQKSAQAPAQPLCIIQYAVPSTHVRHNVIQFCAEQCNAMQRGCVSGRGSWAPAQSGTSLVLAKCR